MGSAYYQKEDYLHMARKRIIAFVKISDALGKDHAITMMMGSLAWGRHKAEHRATASVQDAIREVAFLDGYYDCLNLWARDNDIEAQKVMHEHYPIKFEKAPT